MWKLAKAGKSVGVYCVAMRRETGADRGGSRCRCAGRGQGTVTRGSVAHQVRTVTDPLPCSADLSGRCAGAGALCHYLLSYPEPRTPHPPAVRSTTTPLRQPRTSFATTAGSCGLAGVASGCGRISSRLLQDAAPPCQPMAPEPRAGALRNGDGAAEVA